jgi:hypothetical protein
MAIPMIKATYSLDVATVRALESLAERGGISKSEVVRRAIRQAARSQGPFDDALDDALAALDELQRMLSDGGVSVEEWVEQVKSERRDTEEARRGRNTP